jgi:hypothetical protein
MYKKEAWYLRLVHLQYNASLARLVILTIQNYNTEH